LAIEDFLEASPKKSNNVRLSRYMYELFDDELNSADGTMVVKGIGEVIIPTSGGVRLQPRLQEEIDSKTLSAALAPGARGVAGESDATLSPRVEPGVRVVRDDQGDSAKTARPNPPLPSLHVAPEVSASSLP